MGCHQSPGKTRCAPRLSWSSWATSESLSGHLLCSNLLYSATMDKKGECQHTSFIRWGYGHCLTADGAYGFQRNSIEHIQTGTDVDVYSECPESTSHKG